MHLYIKKEFFSPIVNYIVKYALTLHTIESCYTHIQLEWCLRYIFLHIDNFNVLH
jgi:hypothetical protein